MLEIYDYLLYFHVFIESPRKMTLINYEQLLLAVMLLYNYLFPCVGITWLKRTMVLFHISLWMRKLHVSLFVIIYETPEQINLHQINIEVLVRFFMLLLTPTHAR